MKILRTPDQRFARLTDFPFQPRYLDILDPGLGPLRMAYVESGPARGPVTLLLHGEPSWSYLYRHMIPRLAKAGLRVIAPDLIGFGRSDKPAEQSGYSYAAHVNWVDQFLQILGLDDICLFAQDWGGLIGLRLVASHPQRFARVAVANTGLPTGDHPVSEAFLKWREFARNASQFTVGKIVDQGCVRDLEAAELAAYDAPFPDEAYKAGARIFPSLVPVKPDDPASQDNREAWRALKTYVGPFLTLFSDSDPITRGGESVFQKLVPGAAGQAHQIIPGAGHFLQEDAGARLADILVAFSGTGPG